MQPVEPFPYPSNHDDGESTDMPGPRRPGAAAVPTRRRRLWITIGAAAAVPVLALAWYFGVGYVNTLVATSGHGTHGTFDPSYKTCRSTTDEHHVETKTCAWHGTFTPDGEPSASFDVAVPLSNGKVQEAWHVHLLPGTESAVVPATTSSRIGALIPAAVLVVFLLVASSVLRPLFRRRRKTRTPTPPRHCPDDPSGTGSIPGLTTY